MTTAASAARADRRRRNGRPHAEPAASSYDWLPDAIAAAEEEGCPVVYRVDTEPHPATRRLMDTLGVKVEVRTG